jgi:hypothetical protein
MGEFALESATAIGNLRGTLLRVIDVNGIVGYGFVIEHGGLEQLSVAWPDRAAERFTQDMCERHKIHTEIVFPEFDPEDIENNQSSGLDSIMSEETKRQLQEAWDKTIPAPEESEDDDDLPASKSDQTDQSEPSKAGNTQISGDSGSTIVENADSIELSSTGIPGVNILIREGFKTIGDVKKYIAENGGLIPVKGIGEKLNAEIFDFLTKAST